MATTAALIFGTFMVAACGAAEPTPGFFARHICTVWAGQCQPYNSTVDQVAQLCRGKGAAQWEVTNESRAILRCSIKDELTTRTNELAFIFAAYENRGTSFASVEGLALNGIAQSPVGILNFIANLDAGLVQQAGRNGAER
jgi:hypothetical protein